MYNLYREKMLNEKLGHFCKFLKKCPKLTVTKEAQKLRYQKLSNADFFTVDLKSV
jgi:hypothetical protein